VATITARPDNLKPCTRAAVGAFAGMSLQFSNAKTSTGYRADFFFNAVDNGINARKSENIGFYGPFASVSAGLGDRTTPFSRNRAMREWRYVLISS
jgi:hypothetical protein